MCLYMTYVPLCTDIKIGPIWLNIGLHAVNIENPKDIWWFIHHFSSMPMDKTSAPDRNIDYPQVPGSVPAENPRLGT